MKKFIITEEEKSRILGMHKSYASMINEQVLTDEEVQNRLAVLYIMKTQKLDKLKSENYLKNEGGYDNFITGFDGQNEPYMDWLKSIGLERGDVYIDGGNRDRVLTKLKELEK
jgi:hypothetical protein